MRTVTVVIQVDRDDAMGEWQREVAVLLRHVAVDLDNRELAPGEVWPVFDRHASQRGIVESS